MNLLIAVGIGGRRFLFASEKKSGAFGKRCFLF